MTHRHRRAHESVLSNIQWVPDIHPKRERPRLADALPLFRAFLSANPLARPIDDITSVQSPAAPVL